MLFVVREKYYIMISMADTISEQDKWWPAAASPCLVGDVYRCTAVTIEPDTCNGARDDSCRQL